MAAGPAALTTDPTRFDRIVEILSHYPEVDDDQCEELILFLQKAPALDNALLTSIPEIRPKLEAVRKDHKREFGFGLRHAVLVGLLLLGLAASGAMLWDAAL